MVDGQEHTALEYAMESQSRATVAEVLRGYTECLSQKRIMPANILLAQEKQVSEMIDVGVLSECLEKYPDVAL